MGGTLTISGMSSSEPAGQRVFGPQTITGATTIGETLSVPLASGDNTFQVPQGSIAAYIIGPVNNTATLLIRTSLNSSDAGLPINSAGAPFVYAFPAAAPTSLIINSASAVSSFTTIVFI